MKYFAYIINIFRSLTNPYPMRDWYLVLGVSILTTFVFVGISVYFFIGIQAGFIVGGQGGIPQDAPPSISRDAIQKTLKTYETRSVNFTEGNYPVPPLSDPSR